MRVIPLPSSDTPSVSQETTLDGQTYTLIFDWSARTNSWSMGIVDSLSTLLASGILLTPFTDLLRSVTSDSRPGGKLYCVSPGYETPSLESINDSYLVYAEIQDLDG